MYNYSCCLVGHVCSTMDSDDDFLPPHLRENGGGGGSSVATPSAAGAVAVLAPRPVLPRPFVGFDIGPKANWGQTEIALWSARMRERKAQLRSAGYR